MSRKDDEIHTQLGIEHAAMGLPRYKYQDPRLQQLYDKGYNSEADERYEPEAFNRHRCPRCGKSMTNSFYAYCSNCRTRQ
jgi:hypothetical protein